MTTCPICDNIYSSHRPHCPTCGTQVVSQTRQWLFGIPEVANERGLEVVIAWGAERATQDPRERTRAQASE